MVCVADRLILNRAVPTGTVGGRTAIVPSIEGWARTTGYNTIFIDDRDPYAQGFSVV